VTPAGVVTTLAGSGATGSTAGGYADGPAAQALFNIPEGVSVDGSGNVYVAELTGQRVRKITPSGTVSTLAGSGKSGQTDGIGTAAQFDHPHALTAEPGGTVYVADGGNNRIRRITVSGQVTTVAGAGDRGTNDGQGTAARFYGPDAIAVDGEGNLYVADTLNNRIRKVTPAGAVTTLAGSTSGSAEGQGASAQFSDPEGVAVDAVGNVYVADTCNHAVRRVTPAGAVTTLVRLSSESTTTSLGTNFCTGPNDPSGIVVDGAGNIYVSLPWGQVVLKISSQKRSGSLSPVPPSLVRAADPAVGVADRGRAAIPGTRRRSRADVDRAAPA
jgi:sugar lactone lactonase YvrE